MNKNKSLSVILLFITIQTQAQIININDIRKFNINENTVITIDGNTINTVPIDIIGSGGYKIRFRIADDVNATISQGTFSEINLISDIIGPITSIQPFTILDQEVFITADTVLDNHSSMNDLSIGNFVKISGAINAVDNSIELSRLELGPTISEWKLRGFARNITPTTFSIGTLTVNNNGLTPSNCLNNSINNAFVSIKASADLSYSSGQILTTLTAIECQTADVDEDSNDSVPVVIEGVVSDFVDLVSFKINNLTVFFDEDTSFDNGELEHLDVGTKIEVQGLLDTNNRLIDAQTIRFIHHRVKIIAPVAPIDITLNQSIVIMGINVQIIPQTRDDDEIISSGLIEETQVELRGFVDSEGNVFAQRVKDVGDADAQETKLRGDVTAINQPFITVLGKTIDTTNSFMFLDDITATSEEFFAELQIGMQLSIEDASYNEMTNTLTLGEVEIEEQELEDDPDDFSKDSSKEVKIDIIGSGGVGIATITGSEVIFNSGFE